MRNWKKKMLMGILISGWMCTSCLAWGETAGKPLPPPRQYAAHATATTQSEANAGKIRLLGGHRAGDVDAAGRNHKDIQEAQVPQTLVDTHEQVVYQQGRLLNNREVPMQLLPTKIEDMGGTLLFSDSPEYVKEDGILYQDTVLGDARVLYYHLNETNQPKKLTVVLENPNERMIEVKVTRGGASQPSSDYLKVGKRTQIQYFQNEIDERIILLQGEGRHLRHEMRQTTLYPGQLVYGVYDFSSQYPVKVSVVMHPPMVDPVQFVQQAKVLPKDEQRLRGTFHGMNRKITSTTIYDPKKHGVAYVMIGDDVRDPFREGIDATDGSLVKNVGNYGILYQFALPTKWEKTQYYLTPLGGVYAGAVRMHQGGAGRLIETPVGPYIGDVIPQDTEADIAARAKGGGRLQMAAPLMDLGSYMGKEQVYFEYSPPGASNLPIALLLMP